MMRNKRYEVVKSLRSIASTLGRLFFIFLVAAILLAGWDQEARGQKESTPNADPPAAASETVDDPHKEPVLTTESTPRSQSDNAPIIPSPEVKQWIERFEELSNAIQIGQLDQEFADLFYKELNAALTDTRNRLRDALTALDTAPVSQPAKVSSAKGAKRSSGTNTEPEKGASPPDKATEDRERAFLDAKQLREDLNVLYRLRTQTLGLVSPDLRDRITGTGFEGVQAFKEEIDYLSLRFRYRINLLPRLANRRPEK